MPSRVFLASTRTLQRCIAGPTVKTGRRRAHRTAQLMSSAVVVPGPVDVWGSLSASTIVVVAVILLGALVLACMVISGKRRRRPTRVGPPEPPKGPVPENSPWRLIRPDLYSDTPVSSGNGPDGPERGPTRAPPKVVRNPVDPSWFHCPTDVIPTDDEPTEPRWRLDQLVPRATLLPEWPTETDNPDGHPVAERPPEAVRARPHVDGYNTAAGSLALRISKSSVAAPVVKVSLVGVT
jgi:hypothetical protein